MVRKVKKEEVEVPTADSPQPVPEEYPGPVPETYSDHEVARAAYDHLRAQANPDLSNEKVWKICDWIAENVPSIRVKPRELDLIITRASENVS